jgi:uncharacterized membrane protein
MANTGMVGGRREAAAVVSTVASVLRNGARVWRAPWRTFRTWSAARQLVAAGVVFGALGDGVTTAYGLHIDGGEEANRHAVALMNLVGTDTYLVLSTAAALRLLRRLSMPTCTPRNPEGKRAAHPPGGIPTPRPS